MDSGIIDPKTRTVTPVNLMYYNYGLNSDYYNVLQQPESLDFSFLVLVPKNAIFNG